MGNNTSATFAYSGTSNGATATQTATINFTNRVWYVNSSGANGDGRSNTPFNNMNNADTSSVANDYVFVHTGAAYDRQHRTRLTVTLGSGSISGTVAAIASSTARVINSSDIEGLFPAPAAMACSGR